MSIIEVKNEAKCMQDIRQTLTNFVLDVDGVLTTGQFLYTEDGKFAKVFGAHDNDGIKFIAKYLQIQTISADRRGFAITKKRVEDDMNLPLELVPEAGRLAWFKEKFDLSTTVYMGDGFHDASILKNVAYGIAPANAVIYAREHADYVTKARSGEGAVFEACMHILDKFFGITALKLLE